MDPLTVILLVVVVLLWSRSAVQHVRRRRAERALAVAFIDSRRSRAA